jgi:hypothetical protein
MYSAYEDYFLANGREVFESGGRRLWRCPVCAWWRDWETLSCCGCGAQRDDQAVEGTPARTEYRSDQPVAGVTGNSAAASEPIAADTTG